MVKSARTSIYVTRWILLASLAVVLIGPGQVWAQSRYSGIVVFGTSLSDSGNAFVLLGDQNTPADFDLNPFLIPTRPYAKGGHHFSNGATWIEQYAQSIGLGDAARPALAGSGGSNFAVGAARAYNDGSNYNLTQQVDTYLAPLGATCKTAAPDTLYVIEMGGNDVRDAFQAYLGGGPPAANAIITAALTSIASNIGRLYCAAGARNFLVWASPNIALTPALRSLGAQAGALATGLTVGFNGGLTLVLGQLNFALPGTSFARLDAFQILQDMVDTPDAFGLQVVTAPCLTPNAEPFSCNQADGYLFWDGIHPTRAGHAVLATETAKVLQ
jgi:phospholipase/lecithinase/hemolysin